MVTQKIKIGLNKTRERIIKSFLSTGIFRNKDFESSIPLFEEILLSADVGFIATNEITERLRKQYRKGEDFIALLKRNLIALLNTTSKRVGTIHSPYTILAAGVNGTGKTTMLAKLAKYFKDHGERVLLVASDTYRAAGFEQLAIWGKRIGVDILGSQMGQDPASVAFDAEESAISKGYTTVLIDTAGRLHTNKNLMGELNKIKRVLHKKREDLPQDILLSLDATTGQNALSQVKIFDEALDLTGVCLNKIDGTAKGGIVFAILLEFGIPVRYIGVGEDMNDLIEFKPEDFVDSLLNGVELK